MSKGGLDTDVGRRSHKYQVPDAVSPQNDVQVGPNEPVMLLLPNNYITRLWFQFLYDISSPGTIDIKLVL